jgi:hypothetical protein
MTAQRFIVRKCRIDYLLPLVGWFEIKGEYVEIPDWIRGAAGYVWDNRLFRITGCLDSELL